MNLRTQDRPEALDEEALEAPRPRSGAGVAAAVVALLVVAALVVVLLSPTERDPVVEAPASPEAVPAVEAQPPPPPPPLAALDLVAEARRLESADHHLRLHPNPDLVGTIYDVENPVYAEAVAFQRMLVSGERRYDPLPHPWPIADARLLSQTGDTARVVLRFSATPAMRVLDRAGQVLTDRPAGPAASVVWTLKARDGQWRILGADAL